MEVYPCQADINGDIVNKDVSFSSLNENKRETVQTTPTNELHFSKILKLEDNDYDVEGICSDKSLKTASKKCRIVVMNDASDIERTTAVDVLNGSIVEEKCRSFSEENVALRDKHLSGNSVTTADVEVGFDECAFETTCVDRLSTEVNGAEGSGELLTCCLCDYESRCRREYYKHVRLHFPGPPYRCDFESCTVKCERIQHLLYHRMNHTNERPYSCSLCSLKFKMKSTLMIHLRKHTGYNPFTCAECGRSFSTKGALQQHEVTHSEKKKFLCDQCGFSTKHQSHLISHRRIHAGDVLRCQFGDCAYKTTKRSQLMSHVQSHLSIKTFYCEQCGQGFVAKSHLKRHALMHAPNKPFACDDCAYSCNRKDKLRLHVTRRHARDTNGVATTTTTPPRQTVRHVQSRKSGVAPRMDDDDATCAAFEKMMQQVDEQLRTRRRAKYMKARDEESVEQASTLRT